MCKTQVGHKSSENPYFSRVQTIKEIIVWEEKMHTKPQKPCVSGVFLYSRIFMGCSET